MSKPKQLKPGSPAPASGQYAVLGPKGGLHGEVTSIKGRPLPPTPKPRQSYKLVDGTKNGAGKPR